MPPNRPIIIAKIIEVRITPGVMRNANTTSLKVTWFDVPVVIPLNGSISTIPIVAPISDSITASSTNDVKILGRENPITRSVAISRDRYATAAYIVFIAAKLEPIAIMIATNQPMNLMTAPELVCFS